MAGARGKPRPFKLSSPIIREWPLHKQIADVLAIELAPPGRLFIHPRGNVVWYAIDIADFAGAVPGARISRGVVAGILDLYVLHAGRAHKIEIKADDGILSDAQRSVTTAILGAGGRVGIARNADEAIQLLDSWAIPRNHRVRIAA